MKLIGDLIYLSVILTLYVGIPVLVILALIKYLSS